MQHPRAILITAPQAGSGGPWRWPYAAPGVRLTLLGRNEQRLTDVVAAAEARGATVIAIPVDVRDREAMHAAVLAADSVNSIDLVIANAGITTGLSDTAVSEDPEAVRAFAGDQFVRRPEYNRAVDRSDVRAGPRTNRCHRFARRAAWLAIFAGL